MASKEQIDRNEKVAQKAKLVSLLQIKGLVDTTRSDKASWFTHAQLAKAIEGKADLTWYECWQKGNCIVQICVPFYVGRKVEVLSNYSEVEDELTGLLRTKTLPILEMN